MKLTTKFDELGLSPLLLKSINRMGFEEATPIQAETIPVTLQGYDVIGQAQTGTGKTVAFGVPLLERINVRNPLVQGLIIAPTRELAVQVSEELYKLGQDKRVKVLSIYGGQDIQRQIRALKKGPHIIVGTPGRIMDHMNRGTIDFSHVHTVVLDEADEMLNMGFVEDIEAILSKVPAERQTLLFSATMPGPIRSIANRFMKDPKLIRTKAKEMTVPQIEQSYIEVHEKKKFDVLTRLLDIQSPELAIVFGRTKRRVDELANALTIRGYTAEGIHGDLTQAKRLAVLKKFKSNAIDILVATDVAARGLDISGVTHVYNFDIPQDPESYVHRIGRTGRAGKTGTAITFVTPRETSYLRVVEETTKKKMNKMKVPSFDEAIEGQQRMVIEQLQSIIERQEAKFYYKAAEELLEKEDAVAVVAAALKMLTKEPNETPIELTSEPPLPVRRDRKGDKGGKSYNRKNASSSKSWKSSSPSNARKRGSGKRFSNNNKRVNER
ncbi:MAG TPA: DEAD/DEAH box helicase [Bacillus sp. (in: firmicutes)]|uniref:DEAD/DEAH box helicase n=2 Tax=Bacillus litorisediminis TaxID=2922713 RepID=UPI001FAE623D|nr:DEAD/DEAH box helicase [Bacillus litorisediminis]HWO76779.1 DEAD/DEAH box helicase [Bacillus sp. (in: firmicutes)]